MSHTRIFSVAPRLLVWLCALAGCVLLCSAPAFAKEVHKYEYSFGSKGSGPGQLENPAGIAVNDTTHDVYVVDRGNNRVEEFNSTGSTLLAEFNGSAAPTGALSEPTEIAIDNSTNPLDPSKEDVYVVDSGHGVIDKFSPTGAYEGQLIAPSSVYEDEYSEFENLIKEEMLTVAVDPHGVVWVVQQVTFQAGHRHLLTEYEHIGDYVESFSDALSNEYLSTRKTAFGSLFGLGVSSEDNLYFYAGSGRFVETNSAGESLANPFGGDEKALFGVAVDPVGGEVYLDNETSVEAFSLSGAPIESCQVGSTGCFGSGHLTHSMGVAVDASDGNVYATDGTQDDVSFFEAFIQPEVEVGPLSGQSPRGVTLNGSVNPESRPVSSCVFEYGATSAYGQSVPCPPASLGEGASPVPVSVQLTGLAPESVYHYRLSAENSGGKNSSKDFMFHTGPILGGEWAGEVASTSATLADAIDPNGADTHYYIQYGPTTAYGSYAPVPVPGVDLGEGTGSQDLSVHLQGLQVGTLFHYSFVAVQDDEAFEEADHTFTTQPSAVSSGLVDGRSWELVSPANKKGAVLELNENGGQVQAADDGSGIAYLGEGPSGGENTVGKFQYFQAVSRRTPNGWQTADVSLPGRLPENGESAELLLKSNMPYRLFSPDLAYAVVEPQEFGTPPLSSGESERTLYVRNDLTGAFSPLVSPGDVPEGTKIEEEHFMGDNPSFWEMHFLAATPDLSHIIFETPKALTGNAIDEETVQGNIEAKVPINEEQIQSNLYEWGSSGLQLVNVLPGNNAVAHGPYSLKFPTVHLAGMNKAGGLARGGAQRSVSVDGARVAWTWGEPFLATGLTEYRGLFVRDLVEERTVQIGGPTAVYQTMNSEGSKIFYVENGDLFVYDWNSEVSTDLTAAHGSEPNGGVQELVSDVSEDGSYAYFVAKAVLAAGGVGGEYNLYLLHDTNAGWTTSFIAALGEEDKRSWYGERAPFGSPFLADVSSRVSPDGRFLVFMSNRSLTGYDNADAENGARDEEVFLYDEQSGRLTCVSCNPTGARPVGVFDGSGSRLLVDRREAWTAKESETNDPEVNHWLAGSVPGWDNLANDPTTYQPRYLSDSGRVFFDSPDALVPGDTNGLEDAYEFEPEGIGGCASTTEAATVVYVKELAGRPVRGCVGLISSGTSSTESAFYDASENGDDVFFDTTSKLVGEDYDKGYDVYDAHVCSTAVPCRQALSVSPPCTSGDSCKAAPSPQPELFGPAPSATFNGVGNTTVSSTGSGVKQKSLTNVQKLARALGACHKQKGRRRRQVCERQAHKRYPVKRAGKSAAAEMRRKGS